MHFRPSTRKKNCKFEGGEKFDMNIKYSFINSIRIIHGSYMSMFACIFTAQVDFFSRVLGLTESKNEIKKHV